MGEKEPLKGGIIVALVIKKCNICSQAVVCEEHKKPICEECSGKLSDLYSEMRNYMRDHADQRFTVADLAEIFSVDEKQVRYLLETGYFSVDDPALRSESILTERKGSDTSDGGEQKKGQGWRSSSRKRR